MPRIRARGQDHTSLRICSVFQPGFGYQTRSAHPAPVHPPANKLPSRSHISVPTHSFHILSHTHSILVSRTQPHLFSSSFPPLLPLLSNLQPSSTPYLPSPKLPPQSHGLVMNCITVRTTLADLHIISHEHLHATVFSFLSLHLSSNTVSSTPVIHIQNMSMNFYVPTQGAIAQVNHILYLVLYMVEEKQSAADGF